MKVFKFGGASIKDGDAVRNVVHVLNTVGYDNTLIVVSAMGKTTNALEEVVDSYFDNAVLVKEKIAFVQSYHQLIIRDLFGDEDMGINTKVNLLFEELKDFIKTNKSPNYNFVYDQIVSLGELVSTTILSEYLKINQMENEWLDARDVIKTDVTYRDAVVDWKQTEEAVSKHVKSDVFYITQGFIGSDSNRFTVTLGREGSDYSAAIFAYCLGAESVTIWKDVPGVLNADPRYFEETILLQQISYKEAIEMAFYGASVIHPKTLQPLQEKVIPLYVKSFLYPLLPGTSVSKGLELVPKTPTFIVKKDQVLLSISSKEFAFIMEDNISSIFKIFGSYHIKVNVIQNSAISFTVCAEDKFQNFDKLIAELGKDYRLQYNKNVTLYTIRHFTEASMQKVIDGKEVLLQQINRETIQIVTL